MDTASVRVAEPTLFASLDPLRLVGTRCADCGTVSFPAQTGCARCTGNDLAPVALPDRGTVWTWTVQAFEPKPPYRAPLPGFVQFAVGYVDLGEVIVETRLAGDPDSYTIGDAVQLVLLPVWDDDGAPVATYAFTHAGAAS